MTPFVCSLPISSAASDPIGGERVFLCTLFQTVHYVFSTIVVLIFSISTGYCVPWQRSKAEKFAQQFNRIYRSRSKIGASKMGFTELTNPHKASNLPGLVEVINCRFYLSLGRSCALFKVAHLDWWHFWMVVCVVNRKYNKSNTNVKL